MVIIIELRTPAQSLFLKRLFLLVTVIFLSFFSLGWIYPEHREIFLIAINDLDPERSRILAEIWTNARIGCEDRLSKIPADTTLKENPASIDYAAWPAISGDHSCSPNDLIKNVLETDWILGVADVAARLKRRLKEVGWERHHRINVLRDSDIELQKVDMAYATRAGSNNVHFLLARPDVFISARNYLSGCLEKGAELNAIGAYTWFHLSALDKASQLNNPDLSAESKSALSLAALADEAFALHFIEDVFASGHVAGTRGDASLRKGTHDYYNEKGLAVNSWSGESMVLLGDAWMRYEDAVRAANVVRASLEQFLDIAGGRIKSIAGFDETILAEADTFNVCRNNYMPQRTVHLEYGKLLADILLETPAPGLAEGSGELPRFRAEFGPFIGIMSGMYIGTHSGGFINNQTQVGGTGGIEVALRMGFGLEGVMNESGDGMVFLDLGIRQDAASSSHIVNSAEAEEFGDIFSDIPGRQAYLARLRMPYWLIPGDLLLAAPFLAFTTPETYANMAVVAANGGLLGWQSGIATSIGRFQLLLGREISAYFYGYGNKKDRVLSFYDNNGYQELFLVDIQSLRLDFPIFDYRPFRSFSRDQSSSLVLQLIGGIEFPINANTIAPEDFPDPEVKNIVHVGLHISFDWRGYF